jgi:hypothetical protein
MTERATEHVVCSVCGRPAEAAMTAVCNWCDARYHLNQRNDVEGTDCGAVWIDEQYLALQFACNTCLAAQASTSGERPLQGLGRPNRSAGPRRRRYRRRA